MYAVSSLPWVAGWLTLILLGLSGQLVLYLSLLLCKEPLVESRLAPVRMRDMGRCILTELQELTLRWLVGWFAFRP